MKSIGIKLADGTFYPILEEGTAGSRNLTLTTVQDNQTTVHVDLYRSESGTMDDAEYVDTLEIKNLNPHENGEPTLNLQIDLDENNELSAVIHDEETGKNSQTTLALVSRTVSDRNAEPVNFNIDEVTGESAEITDTFIPSDETLDSGVADTTELPVTEQKEETELIGPSPNDEEFSFDETDGSFKAEQQETAADENDIFSNDIDLPDFEGTSETTQDETEESDSSAGAFAAGAAVAGAAVLGAAALSSDSDEENIPLNTEEPVKEETAVEEEVAVNEDTAFTDDATSTDDAAVNETDAFAEEPAFNEEAATGTTGDDFTEAATLNDATLNDATLNEEPAATDDFALPDFDTPEETVSAVDDVPEETADNSFELPDFENTDAETSVESDTTSDAADDSEMFNMPDFTDANSASDTSDETSGAEAVGLAGVFDDDYGEVNLNTDEEEEKTTKDPTFLPKNEMFSDLYDKETIEGNSTYEGDDEIKKKTRTPVIICIICALICIIAVLLLLFIIPSPINLIKKGPAEKECVTEAAEKDADSKDTTDDSLVIEQETVYEEELPPEPAPVAKEDEIVVAAKDEVVVPEVPAVKEKKPDISYKIKWGDTLWDIAGAYYKNPWRYKFLARYNGIKNPDKIISGRWLKIPQE